MLCVFADSEYMLAHAFSIYLWFAWLREEIEKREKCEREYEKREKDEKYSKFERLLGLREREEK
jgi:nicotinamide riboside transporter PnuC